MVKGYCVKCRVKKDMDKIEDTELKNGRPAFYGFCPDCKTGHYNNKVSKLFLRGVNNG